MGRREHEDWIHSLARRAFAAHENGRSRDEAIAQRDQSDGAT